MSLPRPSRRQADRSARRLQARRRPIVEDLEGRQLLSTFDVTNVNSSGPGSLAQAILSSNTTTGTVANTISFDLGTGGTQTINLKSALPAVTQPVVIDGTTQPGTGTSPRVVLVGTGAGSKAVGLDLEADNSTIKGLAIDDFAGGGVLVSAASGDSITDDYIGVNAAGSATAGNGGFGISLTSGSSGNSITDDVISGNGGDGVDLGNGSYDNIVASDFIGTGATGGVALGNADNGVFIDTGSHGNTIGGVTATPGTAAGNVISGNKQRGVWIFGAGCASNVVSGNLVGLNAAGTGTLANGYQGIEVSVAGTGNVVGGTSAGARNVISGNGGGYGGVYINGTSGTLVAGNDIGTDITGTKAIGNSYGGIQLSSGSSDNTIGGTSSGAGNVISGNHSGHSEPAILVSGSANLILGNKIGTNAAGSHSLGNAGDGIDVDGAGNTIGGTAAGTGNLISGNGLNGIRINADDTLVQGNLIGTDVTGTHALSNGVGVEYSGIVISGAKGTTVGGTTAAARNVISANGYDGVRLVEGTSGTVVEGNFIGTDITGTHPLSNATNGVEIDAGATNNTIGGSTAGAGNLIADNVDSGVYLDGAATGNLVQSDTIDSNGNSKSPGDGVYIDDSPSTTVSGCTIDGNWGWGILVTSSGAPTLSQNTTVGNHKGSVSG